MSTEISGCAFVGFSIGLPSEMILELKTYSKSVFVLWEGTEAAIVSQ